MIVEGRHRDLVGTIRRMLKDSVVVRLHPSEEDVEVPQGYARVITSRSSTPVHTASEDDRATKSAPKDWVTRALRVRIVSKKLKGGLYYNKKAVVVDVKSSERRRYCQIKTDEGKMLEGMLQFVLLSSLLTILSRCSRGRFGDGCSAWQPHGFNSTWFGARTYRSLVGKKRQLGDGGCATCRFNGNIDLEIR